MMKNGGGAGRSASSRLCLAILAGILVGGIWAYMHPHRWMSGPAADGEADLFVGELEKKLQQRDSEIASLKFQNDQLKSKLRLSEEQKASAERQLVASQTRVKAGPFGTVKAVRTSPAVIPDESVNPELAKLLAKVAINKELIVGVSNKNVAPMLKLWFESIQRAGITNYLVVALDDEIAQFCKQHGVPVYRRDASIPRSQHGAGDNHAISGKKFDILREFLVLGYSVLLSDVDIVYLQNPFDHLYRDCDIESMTDGHSNQTAYGYNDVFDDPKMGWSRYAHTMRIWVFNSGLFYIRPTLASIELLDRVADRLAKEKAWDQAVINEELFFPSRPGYEGLHASKRVMDRLLFLNSKALFLEIRKDTQYANFRPVTVHVNYHPDKYERMQAVVEYYVNGKKSALARFPDGSE